MLSARRSLLLPLATALTSLAVPSASSARLLETRTAVQEVASRDRAGLQRELSLGSYWRNLDPGAEVASGSSKFLQTDPAGFIDGPNLYTAFGNDPVNVGDPSGLRSVFQMPGMSPINYGDDSAWNVTRPPTTFIPDIRPDSPPEAAAYGVAGAAADMGIGSFNQSLAVTLGPAGIVAHHLGYLVPYADEWMPYAGDEAYEDAYLATNIVVAVGGAMVGTAGGVRSGPPRSSLMTRREEMILANRARSAALRARYGAIGSEALHQRINLRPAVRAYAEAVNANRPWSWADDIGTQFSAGERALVRQAALDRGLVTRVPFKPGTSFADFEAAGLVRRVVSLPEELWLATDRAQFGWLDAQIPSGRPVGHTWHHTEIPGRMELVPFGPHNITAHAGGRSPGLWAFIGRGRR